MKLDRLQVADLLNVGGKDDLSSIQRDGWEGLHFVQFVLQRNTAPGQLPVFEEGLLGRVDDDQAVVAIKQGGGAVLNFFAGHLQTDHGGKLQRTGHDGAVGGFAAHVGAESQGVLPVEQRHLGGGQIFGDQNARLLEVLRVRLGAAAEQIVHDAGGDIAHVNGAFLQVGVVNGAESGLVLLGELVEGGLDVDLLVINQLGDRINQSGVFEDEQMGVENAGVFGVEGLADLVLDLQDLLAGFQQGLLQALHLVGHARLLHGIFRDVHGDFVEDEHLAMGNPGGDGNALVHTLARLERLGHKDYLAGNQRLAKQFFRNSQKSRREGGTGRLNRPLRGA